MKRYVISDIHGSYRALVQVLERAKFDYEKDLLIINGDIVDGWPDSLESIEEILKIKNIVYVLGNHDQWFIDYHNQSDDFIKKNYGNFVEIYGLEFAKNEINSNWLMQGGKATLNSYKDKDDIRDKHVKFLEKALPYYILDDMLFVHGGYDEYTNIEEQSVTNLIWDRTLIEHAYYKWIAHNRKNDFYISEKYKYVFVGHTPTLNFKVKDNSKPMFLGDLVAIDTGASYYGPLTLMNIDTLEYYQSDVVKKLYPGIRAR